MIDSRRTAARSMVEAGRADRLTLRAGAVKIRSSCRPVPVSSRGQDTWFSATGPGFESPYRYHPSLANYAERATDGKPSFAGIMRRATWRCHASSVTDRRRMSTVARSSSTRAKVDRQDVTDLNAFGFVQPQFPCLAPVTAQSRFPSDSTRQAACPMRGMPRRFVYVLRNADNPPRYYTGLTADVATRLTEHNAGSCSSQGGERSQPSEEGSPTRRSSGTTNG